MTNVDRSLDIRLSRRNALRGAVGIAAGTTALLTGCGGSRTEESSGPVTSAATDEFTSANIDWRQFDGTTLNLSVLAHPWSAVVKPLLPEFTKLTGIKVNATELGEDQYVSKIAVQLSGGASTPDVFMVNQFGQAAGSNWLAPVDDFLADTKLTDPKWYGFDDFFEGARTFGQSENKTLAVPITSEVQMLFCRDDLIESPPATMADLLDLAPTLSKGNVAGFASRCVAVGNQTPWPFGGFSFTHGGEFLDADGSPAFATDANQKALADYKTLVTKAGPRGVTSWGYLECSQAMTSGRLAIWPDSSSLLGGLKDSSKTRFADKISAYPFPTVDDKAIPNVWYWVVGINAKSANAEAAWLFVQWATSKSISQAAGLKGASPARASSWEAATASETIGKDNAARILAALKSTPSEQFAAAWQNPAWAGAADVLARGINSAVAGADPAETLASVQRQAMTAMKK